MTTGDIIKCSNCDGKGHVMDAAGLFLPIIGWAMMALERNDKNGITRNQCSHCKGKGYYKILA